MGMYFLKIFLKLFNRIFVAHFVLGTLAGKDMLVGFIVLFAAEAYWLNVFISVVQNGRRREELMHNFHG